MVLSGIESAHGGMECVGESCAHDIGKESVGDVDVALVLHA